MSRLYLVCYDIPEDRVRGKVARLLEGYGDRVQESVFECWLDRRHLIRLRERLAGLIDEEADKIRIYSLCGKDNPDRRSEGRRAEVSKDDDFAIA